VQPAPELFLVVHRLAVEQLEDQGLPSCLHLYSLRRVSIHDRCDHDVATGPTSAPTSRQRCQTDIREFAGIAGLEPRRVRAPPVRGLIGP
jgi:hypothetical protein